MRFLPLATGTNTLGAAKIGLAAHPVKGDFLFALLGDDWRDGQALPAAKFTVVQAAYRTPLVEAADVVLPALVWTEKDGHIVNLEGRTMPVRPAVRAPETIPADDVTIRKLLL